MPSPEHTEIMTQSADVLIHYLQVAHNIFFDLEKEDMFRTQIEFMVLAYLSQARKTPEKVLTP